MIHSQVQASNIGTMGFKVICAPKLKTIPNQEGSKDPNQMREKNVNWKVEILIKYSSEHFSGYPLLQQ